MHWCLQDLADLMEARLVLGRMPPVAGAWTPVTRVVFDAAEVMPGDLLWCLDAGSCDEELAYFRGAAGVVTERAIEPWPGRYALCVSDSAAALAQVAAALVKTNGAGETFVECSELKDLQLCANQAAAIFPPTCERLSEPWGRLPACQRSTALERVERVD
jgi:hypothetical protein